jgi:hypothetical protein
MYDSMHIMNRKARQVLLPTSKLGNKRISSKTVHTSKDVHKTHTSVSKKIKKNKNSIVHQEKFKHKITYAIGLTQLA